MDELPAKPQIFNRPWHLDLDDRRHHGARRWEREALQALLDLAAGFEFLYPPDWSDRDVVTLRGPRRAGFATVRTDSPDALAFEPSHDLVSAKTAEVLSELRDRFARGQPDAGGAVVMLRTAAEVDSTAFKSCFSLLAESFRIARRPH